MDQRGRKSPSGPGHEGALCALHRAGDVGSCGVDNVEGFTVFVRNSLVVNKQAVAAVGEGDSDGYRWNLSWDYLLGFLARLWVDYFRYSYMSIY